jgi:hypothetical protein
MHRTAPRPNTYKCLFLATIANEISARSLPREWVTLATFKPTTALSTAAANAAFRRCLVHCSSHLGTRILQAMRRGFAAAAVGIKSPLPDMAAKSQTDGRRVSALRQPHFRPCPWFPQRSNNPTLRPVCGPPDLCRRSRAFDLANIVLVHHRLMDSGQKYERANFLEPCSSTRPNESAAFSGTIAHRRSATMPASRT